MPNLQLLNYGVNTSDFPSALLQRREQIHFLIGTCLTLAQEESETDSVDMLSVALAEGVTITTEQDVSHRDPFEIPEV